MVTQGDIGVVAITGAARGIGLATAKALYRAGGVKIAIGDLDEGRTKAAAAEIAPDVLGVRLDVTDPASYANFLDAVAAELGPLDVLINNAGIMPIGPFLDESDQTARNVLSINVFGYLTGMKLALPGMVQRGQGHIVNVASIAGKAPVPGGLTYAASKAAVISMTESARVEYAGTGVHFTCVMPSFTATDLILGTKGTKFMKTLKADDVATQIVQAVENKKKDVFVPAMLGPLTKIQSMVGRTVRDAMQHAIGADRTFLRVDRSARASYESRIAKDT